MVVKFWLEILFAIYSMLNVNSVAFTSGTLAPAGEMNAKLLGKIEELTLYMIEVNKKVNVLQNDNVKLKEENKVLVGKVENIEKRK